MKKPSRKMLDKWAAHIADRRVIEEFLDWVEYGPGLDMLEHERDDALNRYHGIDAKQLERERRALLESIKP